MKKFLFVVAPVIMMVALVAAQAFLKVGHKIAMGAVILALPIVSLISYFIFLQKRDVRSAVRGFCLASIMAALSLLVLFAIRDGEVFVSDFSLYQITTILALALAVRRACRNTQRHFHEVIGGKKMTFINTSFSTAALWNDRVPAASRSEELVGKTSSGKIGEAEPETTISSLASRLARASQNFSSEVEGMSRAERSAKA